MLRESWFPVVEQDAPVESAVDIRRVTFRVLGPVGIRVDGSPLPLRSAKMRYLAAALLLRGGRTASVSRLTEALWNDNPPASAQKNLHQYVYRLRSLLASHGLPDRLVLEPGGYVLNTEPGELDLDRFEALVANGRRAREGGDLARASRSFTEALALWDDDTALADVRDSLPLDGVAHVLSEQRLGAVEERIAVDLGLGRHGRVLPELTALVAGHPLRERLRGYQMLALVASGRKADALAAYQDCRVALARDLGIDPGPALRELLAAILADDHAALTAHLPVRDVPGLYR